MGSAKVVVNTAELTSELSHLVDSAIAEVEKAINDLTGSVADTTRNTWYTQVRRRTGKTGGGIGTAIRVKSDRLKGVVLSDEKRTYVVHRPYSLSGSWRLVKDDAEFSRVASYYRKNGRVPEGYQSQIAKDGHLYYLSKWEWNTLRADGKNLWNELVNKDGKKYVESRAADIEAAVARAVRLLQKG